MRFKGKVAIVTGGGTGIGKAVAEALINEGARVVLNGRREDVLQAAATSIDPKGGRVAHVCGDISRPPVAGAVVEAATQRFGGVDLLFNNAGIFAPKAFLDHSEEDYDRFLGTILKGKFFMAQAAAKAMKARGGGVIVQTGSMWALQAVGATPSSAYSAANAGVHQMVKNLAIELAPAKIRVNAVAPAVVKTSVYSTFLPPDQVDAALASFNPFIRLVGSGNPPMLFLQCCFLPPTKLHGSLG